MAEQVGILWCSILKSLYIFHLAEAQMESDTPYKLLQIPLLFWIAPVTISNVTLLSFFLIKTTSF